MITYAVMSKTTFGSRLRRLRVIAGTSARELDRLAKTPVGLAAMLESGARSNVEVETALKYARALGCSLDWLILGSGKPPAAADVSSAIAAAKSRTAA